MNTIEIGGEQVHRTVVGALNRLELDTVGPCARLRDEPKADVNFLRDHINRIEAQRDECLDALRDLWNDVVGGKKSCGHDFSCLCAGDKVRAVLAKVEGR